MKHIIVVLTAVLSVVSDAANMASQPWVEMKLSHIEAWVKDYVAKHGGGTNAVSETWVRGYVSSNATSEAWVKDYVAKHGGGGTTNAVSETWVRGYVSSNATSEAWVKDYVAKHGGGGGGGSGGGYSAPTRNTLSGALTTFRLAAIRARQSMTNDAYIATSFVTNLSEICLAPISTGLYTNALARVYMLKTPQGLDLRDGETSYTSTNVAELVTLTSATGGVVRLRFSKVTDGEIKIAKGE